MKILGTFQNNCLPDIETNRLYLRQRTLEDAHDIFLYGSLPIVAHNAHFEPAKDVEFYQEWIPDWGRKMDETNVPRGYGITLKGVNRVIGSADFNARHGERQDILEIGYILHPGYWGNGYVPEAVSALIEVAFTVVPDIYKVEIACHSLNTSSQRVAEKLGFTLESRLRGRDEFEGTRCDALRFGLLRSEWECNKR